jgi:hypothetical protein
VTARVPHLHIPFGVRQAFRLVARMEVRNDGLPVDQHWIDEGWHVCRGLLEDLNTDTTFGELRDAARESVRRPAADRQRPAASVGGEERLVDGAGAPETGGAL